MAVVLGRDGKGPCTICHNEIPSVLRLVVEAIPGNLHLFPAHGGYIESPPRRFNGFARFQFVGGKRLSLLLEKFRHLPITDAIHIVGSLFPVLPEYHNIPQRERTSRVISGMFHIEAMVNLVQRGVLIQRGCVDKLVIFPVYGKPVLLQALIGTISEVAPLRAARHLINGKVGLRWGIGTRGKIFLHRQSGILGFLCDLGLYLYLIVLQALIKVGKLRRLRQLILALIEKWAALRYIAYKGGQIGGLLWREGIAGL